MTFFITHKMKERKRNKTGWRTQNIKLTVQPFEKKGWVAHSSVIRPFTLVLVELKTTIATLTQTFFICLFSLWWGMKGESPDQVLLKSPSSSILLPLLLMSCNCLWRKTTKRLLQREPSWLHILWGNGRANTSTTSSCAKIFFCFTAKAVFVLTLKQLCSDSPCVFACCQANSWAHICFWSCCFNLISFVSSAEALADIEFGMTIIFKYFTEWKSVDSSSDQGTARH